MGIVGFRRYHPDNVSGVAVFKQIVSVGAWTLLSRATGFVRDIVMAAILGTGPLADAFVVAFKLPNHFRAIFGEGAFNAAFVPAFARVRETEGVAAAGLFQGRIISLLVTSQLILLALAFTFMPEVIALLAPGFDADPERFGLAVTLTRITFPYLLLITLATLYGGVLNASGRFWAAAAAPVLLNVALIAALASHRLFASPAHAAAWGVTVSGILQLGVLLWAAQGARLLVRPHAVRRDPHIGAFFKALGPATIGSMGTQIAMFADTIIATLLPLGSVSALYYADRIYQLPLGVIGIAAGTVLLPEMSRLVAAGRPEAAVAAQNRTMVLTWVMAAPFFAAFLTIPGSIMHAFFERGAFTAASADAAGAALLAYGAGLPAVVLIRSAVATFYARGDTATPLWSSLTGVAVNLVFKLMLMGPLHQAGLALATSIGAWTNLGILVALATRRGHMAPERRTQLSFGAIALAALVMGVVLALSIGPATALVAHLPRERALAALAIAGLCGLAAYLVIMLAAAPRLGIRLRRARPLPLDPARRTALTRMD